MRLIDADGLKKLTTERNEIWDAVTDSCGRGLTEIIDSLPAVDVAPVVHAHNESETGFLCSACRFGDFGQFNHGGKYTPNFCPNCGAIMDEVSG